MNDRKGSENAMAEGKEYISCPDELGSIHISEDVLAVTAAAAALEVEGVGSLAANLGGLSRQDIAKAIQACGLPADIRGERLSIPQFAQLSRRLRGSV